MIVAAVKSLVHKQREEINQSTSKRDKSESEKDPNPKQSIREERFANRPSRRK
jgi:hypothetical protein